MILALVSTSAVFANVRGAQGVQSTTELLNRQLENINQSNLQLNNIRDENQLYQFKSLSLNSINQMRVQLDQLENKVQNLKLAPPFKISQCVRNDQDHGGLQDRGGSIIYKRDGDFRICARVEATNRKIVIHNVKFAIDGRAVTSLSAFGGNTATVYEGKGKDFSSSLPTLSSNAYSRCIPEYGSELHVSITNDQGERELIALEINPELINFDGERKYQVPVCN